VSQSKANPEPAEIAGRYTVIQKLGAGAFGTVYKAKDKILGRMLAIKTIRLEGLAAQGASLDELMSRFKQEAMVSAQLKHPNIVTIYDIGEAEGLSYLAMEFIDGVGLERIIAQGRLPLERAASLAAQVADALDFAHKSSVVHRDIKPANIMVEAGDRVKVTDFGIAKVTTSGDHLTMTGSLLGTPSYMSPEQARGSQLDGRSDLFAVGCVLYEMLTGKKAFRGDSITGLIFKIITEDPVPIREVEPGIPEEMARIIAKALAKTPETRYQTGRELADDLAALLRPGTMPTLRQAELATSPGLTVPPTQVVASVPTFQGPPTVAAAVATRIAAPPPVPRPAAKPAVAPSPPRAAKQGSALPLIALGVVFLVFAGIAATAAWFVFLRKPAADGVAQTTSTPPAPPTVPAASAPATSLAPAVTAPPQTEAAAAPPPSTAAAGAARSTARPAADKPVAAATTRSAEAPPAPSVAPPTSAGPRSFLDEEPAEPEADGGEAGRRLAEGYRGRSTSGSSFGATGRFQQRERTPRSLALIERPAVATMRHVIEAEEAFYRRNNRYGTLPDLQKAGTLFLDVPIQTTAFLRKGYRFEISVEGSGFRLAAVPLSPGGRPFVGDDSGMIRAGVD
jgi:serine/threonine-protein kinase